MHSNAILEQLSVSVHENIIFDPRYCALYNDRGVLIEESLLTRGENETVNFPPEKIEIDKNIGFFNEAIFIHSFGYHHFGHFLTEQIAKFWYAKLKHYPVLFHNNAPKQITPLFKRFVELPTYHKIFTYNLSENLPERLLFHQRQTRVGRLFLPEGSFVNRHSASIAHKEICQKVGRKLIKPVENQHGIYLSRSKLNKAKRIVQDEIKLEQILANQGVKIVHPELLSLSDQITLINSANFIIGPIGSALHLLLFLLHKNVHVVTLSNPNVNKNFLLIDELMGIDNTYIECLSDFSTASDDTKLDISKASHEILQILNS
jgi:capsular polysaccharide biosynthesis protein